MNKARNWFRNNRTLSILILTALVVRLIIAWLPVNWLLDQGILVDDAFYYFKIAQNITLGNGISFDGLSSTNGFHPLWLIIILPIFLLSLDKLMLLHLALTISAIFGTVSVVVLYYLLKRLNIGKKVRLIAVLFLSLLPTALLSGSGIMNGMETSLNVLLILVFLWSFAGIFNKSGLNYKKALLFGVITGLLFLSRTDNSILIVIFWLVAFYVFAKIKYFGRKPKNFEEFAVLHFGRTIAELNILNYTEKIWGIPCSQISVDWADLKNKGIEYG